MSWGVRWKKIGPTILSPFIVWGKDWGNKEFPPNVSPVFYNLYEYVSKQYAGYRQEYRYAVFANAYLIYSEHKKDKIAAMRLNGAAENSDAIKNLFKDYNNENAFKDFCRNGETVISGALDAAVERSINSSIKSNRSFLRDIGINIIASIISWVFVFSLPVVAYYSGNANASHALNALGKYLTCTFPSESDRKFCDEVKNKNPPKLENQ